MSKITIGKIVGTIVGYVSLIIDYVSSHLKLLFIILASFVAVAIGIFALRSNNYQKACEELNFDKAHKILNRLRSAYVSVRDKDSKNKKEIKKKTDASYWRYVDADLYIFKEEATYLMSLNDLEAENRIIKLLLETPVDGQYQESGTYQKTGEELYHFEDCNLYGGSSRFLNAYYRKRYNNKCDIVLDLSIMYGNQRLAKKILSYYTENAEWYDGNNSWEFSLYYRDRDKYAAQEKYDEAVKAGAFDN